MTKEDRANRRNKRRKFRLVLVIIVVCYLIFRLMPTLYASNSKTVVAENGYIEVTEKTDGILIKNETIFKAEGQGKISQLKKEGQKLGIGVKVAELQLTGNTAALKEELEGIEQSIKVLEESSNSNSMFGNDLTKNQKRIDELVEEIQDNINKENYKEIETLKEELAIRITKQQSISGESSLAAYNLDNLKERRKELKDQISKSNYIYYSEKTGILSYKLDGLEEIFPTKGIEEYTLNEFKVFDKQTTTSINEKEVSYGEPLYKIIDNYTWYVIAKLDGKKSIDSLVEGKDVYIKFNEKEKEYKASVHKINKDKDQALIIFKFDSYLYEFYNERYVDIQIVTKKFEGLKLPRKVIVEKDGIEGVYIKDISGIIKFRPVKRVGQDEEFVIVEEGYIDVKYGDEVKRERTIFRFDEVYINGNRVKEGQIAN